MSDSGVNAKRIDFFDFDQTLFKTPGPEEGKVKYEAIYGKPYPHVGWISKSESLDPNLGILPIEAVHRFDRESIDSRTVNVLLSDRLPTMQESIQRILGLHDIRMDAFPLNSGPHKPKRLQRFLEDFPYDIAEINLFDDKASVLHAFVDWKVLHDVWESPVRITVYRVVEGEVVVAS